MSEELWLRERHQAADVGLTGLTGLSLLEKLMKLSMEELVQFLQETLAHNFYFEDDIVIEQLQASMTELRKAKLDLPAPGAQTHTHTQVS